MGIEAFVERHGEYDLRITEEDLRQGFKVVGQETVPVHAEHQYGLRDLELKRISGRYHITEGDCRILRELIQPETVYIVAAPGYRMFKPIEAKVEHLTNGEFQSVHVFPTPQGGGEFYGHGKTRRAALLSLFEVMAGFQKDIGESPGIGNYLNTLFTKEP